MMPSLFTPSSASLQHFLQTLGRLEEAFLLSPLSGLEQEGAVRRMRFAVDAGLKAMKDHLAASGHLPVRPPKPAAAAWRRRIIFDGQYLMHMLAQSQLARDDSPETLQAAVKELDSRFLPELARLRDWLVQHPCSGERKQ
ncbi:MAG: nucleotidyltransferase [Bilophila wadsworthia]